MLNKLRSQQGFTLIELLIVVAIIGILAAVAIPQFSAYRIRGFNSAALSDLKNVASAEESLHTTFQTYGSTLNAANLGAALNPPAAPGVVIAGPQAPAAAGVAGASISGQGPDSAGGATVIGALGIGISNGMRFRGDTADLGATPLLVSRTYTLLAKHTSGDREVGAEAEGTAVWACTNPAFVNNAAALPATALAGVTGGADFAGTVACGGAPNANWVAL